MAKTATTPDGKRLYFPHDKFTHMVISQTSDEKGLKSWGGVRCSSDPKAAELHRKRLSKSIGSTDQWGHTILDVRVVEADFKMRLFSDKDIRLVLEQIDEKGCTMDLGTPHPTLGIVTLADLARLVRDGYVRATFKGEDSPLPWVRWELTAEGLAFIGSEKGE